MSETNTACMPVVLRFFPLSSFFIQILHRNQNNTSLLTFNTLEWSLHYSTTFIKLLILDPSLYVRNGLSYCLCKETGGRNLSTLGTDLGRWLDVFDAATLNVSSGVHSQQQEAPVSLFLWSASYLSNMKVLTTNICFEAVLPCMFACFYKSLSLKFIILQTIFIKVFSIKHSPTVRCPTHGHFGRLGSNYQPWD